MIKLLIHKTMKYERKSTIFNQLYKKNKKYQIKKLI